MTYDGMVDAAKLDGRCKYTTKNGVRIICYYGMRSTNPGSGRVSAGVVWRVALPGGDYKSASSIRIHDILKGRINVG